MATATPKSVEDMAPHELNTWLLGKGLDQEYCTLLTEDNEVDGKTFIDITEAELKSDLGITKFGPKKTLLRLIEEAKEQDKETPSMLCYSYDDSQTEDGMTSSDPAPEAAGVCAPFGTTALWKKSPLKVHFTSKDGSIPVGKAWFIDNEPITTSKILDLANEWSANGRACVPKFVQASSKEDSDIRVEFKTSGGSWSHIGSRARDPSMVLNLGVGENDYKKYLVRHEFGHALGLGHEHQSKNAPIGLLNKKEVIDWLVKKGKMTEKEAEEKYHVDYERPRPKQEAKATEYDEGSIMQYWILPDWIDKSHEYARKKPKILQNGINWPPQCTLSEIDQKAIVELYGGMYHQSRSQVDSADVLDEGAERSKPRKPEVDSGDLKSESYGGQSSNGASGSSGGAGGSSSTGSDTLPTSENPEYDKLLEYSSTLITQLAAALCSGTLAQKLRAKQLITAPVYARATNAGLGVTEETRIRPIIEHVLAQTKENRENFHKFLKVLREIEGLQDLIKCLEV